MLMNHSLNVLQRTNYDSSRYIMLKNIWNDNKKYPAIKRFVYLKRTTIIAESLHVCNATSLCLQMSTMLLYSHVRLILHIIVILWCNELNYNKNKTTNMTEEDSSEILSFLAIVKRIEFVIMLYSKLIVYAIPAVRKLIKNHCPLKCS